MQVSIPMQKSLRINRRYRIMNPGIGHRRTLFNLAGYILIILLLPVPVFAQGPVDLTFGETGMFPWKVSGIMPGDHGSTFIDLHNNGTERGLVYLWVDNISSSDRNGYPGRRACQLPVLRCLKYKPQQYSNSSRTYPVLPASSPCCRTNLSLLIH